jgi:hypothetical protein
VGIHGPACEALRGTCLLGSFVRGRRGEEGELHHPAEQHRTVDLQTPRSARARGADTARRARRGGGARRGRRGKETSSGAAAGMRAATAARVRSETCAQSEGAAPSRRALGARLVGARNLENVGGPEHELEEDNLLLETAGLTRADKRGLGCAST